MRVSASEIKEGSCVNKNEIEVENKYKQLIKIKLIERNLQ